MSPATRVVDNYMANLDARLAAITPGEREAYVRLQIKNWRSRETRLFAGTIATPDGWTAIHITVVVLRLHKLIGRLRRASPLFVE